MASGGPVRPRQRREERHLGGACPHQRHVRRAAAAPQLVRALLAQNLRTAQGAAGGAQCGKFGYRQEALRSRLRGEQAALLRRHDTSSRCGDPDVRQEEEPRTRVGGRNRRFCTAVWRKRPSRAAERRNYLARDQGTECGRMCCPPSGAEKVAPRYWFSPGNPIEAQPLRFRPSSAEGGAYQVKESERPPPSI